MTLPSGRSDSIIYCLTKPKYGGLEVNEARGLRQLEHENGRLKRLVADLTLDNQAVKELVGKKAGRPWRRGSLCFWHSLTAINNMAE